jgi:hypothetical protein
VDFPADQVVIMLESFGAGLFEGSS